MAREIVVKGAREHNLKDISVTIPRGALVVMTGLSGSGKSSLAFDTIYAEGQRRYLESLSAYARQFMEQMRKPDVDLVDGLSPSISIEQKNISRNPRSTVGTVTEIYDFLRLMYARLGTPHCFECGSEVHPQSVQQIATRVLSQEAGTRFAVLAPVVRGKKGEYQQEILEWRSQGFTRARIDGKTMDLSEPIQLKKTFKHDISIYIDRLILRPGIESRLYEALDLATSLSSGLAEIEDFGDGSTKIYSTKLACANCGASIPEIEPRIFSFNSSYGACPDCDGLGTKPSIDPEKVVPDATLSVREGAILPWAEKSKDWIEKVLRPLEKHFVFNANVPFADLSLNIQNMLLFGSGKEEIEFKGSGTKHVFRQPFEGVIPTLERELDDDDEEEAENEALSAYITHQACPKCEGTRLKKEARSVTVEGKNIAEFCALPVPQCADFVASLRFTPQQSLIAEPILKEIRARLSFLNDVGLSYLSLDRSAATLSGGESQRIRLATQIGSQLIGVLYVLDEPSIGLHQRDNDRLIHTLEKLRDLGNSVLVVEHDEETMARADYIIDIGPGAGKHGGEVLYQGTPAGLKLVTNSLTGQYLAGTLKIRIPEKRRPIDPAKTVRIEGAKLNNLKSVDVAFPLGTFICVTGVSGSGKSTLILDTLLRGCQLKLAKKSMPPGVLQSIQGLEKIDKVIHIDQSPIGRTPRSNAATYTGTFTDIRTLFAGLPEAKARGYTLSRFSFNVAGGRCDACNGDGNLRITMHFLPDVFVECEVCRGRRYNRETLEVMYRGKNIADVLAMTVEEAATFFERVPSLRYKFKTLLDVGLGYLQVGQNAVTLSGGEAQRIKLAKELNRRATGKTLYILDEPTTGLHFDDIDKLLKIIQSLVEQGNTVVVIEHNLDVVKQADHVIDLGPEGGRGGGEIVFEGTPEGLCEVPRSYTGQYLKKHLV